MTPQKMERSVFPGEARLQEIDLSPAGDFFDERAWQDPREVAAGVEEILGDRTTSRGFTRHLSSTMLYAGQRRSDDGEPATVQIGVVFLTREGEELQAPLAGEVVRADAHGPLVLRHRRTDPQEQGFWTCWWGLDPVVEVGGTVHAADRLGTVAAPSDDRGLGPTVHVQLLLEEKLVADPPPTRVPAGQLQQWEKVTGDPADLLGLPHSDIVTRHLDAREVMSWRDQRLARSQRAYYKRPPDFVRGRGVWLYDQYGRAYLDAINNVTHVGHAEPRVTAAVSGQLKKLNTNSRFLYEGIARYSQRLVETLPAPLEVVFLVCTGSEANDLALRMARQVTGRTDVMVIDGAYHGNTTAVMGISPNRYKGPGGRGAPPTTHEVVRPDVYRGPYGREDPQAGAKYAAEARAVVDRLESEGRPPAAFFAESLMGTAGNIVFPEGYLQDAFQAVRTAGGLCISDEVQVGFGRLGTHFWGFEAQGVVPDIVTMGKPIGNGHPMAAVVTTREIADAFDDGVKYFNTFGGNPVSCAVGMTVLDIVQGDGLQAHAHSVGGYFLAALERLKSEHELIGDVRGHGLYLGIELVRDSDTKEPAAAEALNISELMKDSGVIVYPTGAFDNVLKLKPPMIFDREHVDLFVSALGSVLSANPRG
jgi:4-aminobutyrate aminotransferase-like enzyme